MYMYTRQFDLGFCSMWLCPAVKARSGLGPESGGMSAVH